MFMTHPDLPGQPVTEVDDEAFRTAWQYRGWVEAKPAPPVEDLTVDEVVAEVGDDPALAVAALDAEKKRDRPRTTLTKQLAGIAGTEPTDTPKGS
jgi:hypothetical protein